MSREIDIELAIPDMDFDPNMALSDGIHAEDRSQNGYGTVIRSGKSNIVTEDRHPDAINRQVQAFIRSIETLALPLSEKSCILRIAIFVPLPMVTATLSPETLTLASLFRAAIEISYYYSDND